MPYRILISFFLQRKYNINIKVNLHSIYSNKIYNTFNNNIKQYLPRYPLDSINKIKIKIRCVFSISQIKLTGSF